MNAKLKNPVAGVVISDGTGRYLLVQEKQPSAYGLWNLPAGWIGKGETAQQTAVREAKEEINLDVELIDQKPLLSMHNDTGDRQLNSFSARIVGGQLKYQKQELLDARWFSLDEIEKLAGQSRLRNQWTLESVRMAEENANNRY